MMDQVRGSWCCPPASSNAGAGPRTRVQIPQLVPRCAVHRRPPRAWPPTHSLPARVFRGPQFVLSDVVAGAFVRHPYIRFTMSEAPQLDPGACACGTGQSAGRRSRQHGRGHYVSPQHTPPTALMACTAAVEHMVKYWDPGVSLVYPPEWINATLVPQETVGGFSFSVPVRVLPACRCPPAPCAIFPATQRPAVPLLPAQYLNGTWNESIGGPRLPPRLNYSTAFIQVWALAGPGMVPALLTCWLALLTSRLVLPAGCLASLPPPPLLPPWNDVTAPRPACPLAAFGGGKRAQVPRH